MNVENERNKGALKKLLVGRKTKGFEYTKRDLPRVSWRDAENTFIVLNQVRRLQDPQNICENTEKVPVVNGSVRCGGDA